MQELSVISLELIYESEIISKFKKKKLRLGLYLESKEKDIEEFVAMDNQVRFMLQRLFWLK